MDQRQAEISVGKGLQESRVNQEFIDALKKWGPYVVMALSLVALAYFGVQRLEHSRDMSRDQAFIAYDEAVISRNPATLVEVAQTHAGAGAVEHLARLAAADIYLESFRTGVEPGVKVDREGKLEEGKSLLTKEQRDAQAGKAEALFQKVADAARGQDQILLAAGALSGLAAIAEGRQQGETAKGFYQEIITLTEGKFEALASSAKKRIETLDSLAAAKLYARAELPTPPETPVVTPMTNMQAQTADGKVITINPDGSISQPGATPGAPGTPIQLTPLPGPPAGVPGGPTAPVPVPLPAPAPAPAPANP